MSCGTVCAQASASYVSITSTPRRQEWSRCLWNERRTKSTFLLEPNLPSATHRIFRPLLVGAFDLSALALVPAVAVVSVHMARTSRTGAPAASVDALDNLNLDDMFAGDDVALFDGLDIDLANMDEIAGMDDATLEPMGIQPLEPDVALPDTEDTPDGSSPRRRKAKRKAKAPYFFDDTDEDYVDDKKKKKKITKAPTKKKTTKKASTSVDDSKQPPTPKQKGKAKTAASMPPPLARGTSSTLPTGVAAAGQFGGRRKRGPNTAFIPPKGKAKTTMATNKVESITKLKRQKSSSSASSTQSSQVAPGGSVTAPTAATLQQIQAMHSQNSFCGLLPSNTLYYPFMPALPSEPSLKNRKVFPLFDRIYTSFMSHLGPTSKPPNGIVRAPAVDPIYKLLQDAFKEEKSPPPNAPDKRETVGNAIGASRQTIQLFEKSLVAADLYGVCALLKRQHDFLKQNAANMEKWCKDALTPTDFATVYQTSKGSRKRKGSDVPVAPPPSVLASFNRPFVRVKIVCSGFKDPKNSGPLVAQISAVLPVVAVKEAERARVAVSSAKPSKKRKLVGGPETKSPVSVPVEVAVVEAPTYVQMEPNSRRKNVGELIARVAKEIETKHLLRTDERRVAFERQRSDLLKVATEEEILNIHTSGMWRWIEASGYFSNCGDEELRRRFDGIRSYDFVQQGKNETSRRREGLAGQKSQANADESLFDRLQSLLVEEGGSDSEDLGASDDEDGDDNLYLDGGGEVPFSQMADLSGLSLDERLFLHVRSVGLAESLTEPVESQQDAVSQPDTGVEIKEALSKGRSEKDGDLEDVIDAMAADLDKVSGLNNNRADFLELVASSNRFSVEESKRQTDDESSAITKFQNMLKKSKETKLKNGKPKAQKNDANALPW